MTLAGDPRMTSSQNEGITSKPWGFYRILSDEPGRIVKLLSVDPNQALSLQSHKHRSEQWVVLEGTALVTLDDNEFVLQIEDTIKIPQAATHRLANPASKQLLVLEVQSGDQLSETDITRYKDRYGRSADERSSRVSRQPDDPASEEWQPQNNMTIPVVICEIGCNHRGSMATAIDMIRIAAQFCKVDVIKFQKRSNRELLGPKEYDMPHPNPANSYGDTYGAHREYLEFDMAQHAELKAACEEWGVAYSTSIWDMTSAIEVTELNPVLIKIPSAINTNFPVIEYLCKNYSGEIHISLGMTLRQEEDELIALIAEHDRLKDTVLYHCISGYPIEEKDLFLLEIQNLKERFDGKVKGVGFSGHHKGIGPDVAALALGAEYFERHFTLDRTWKGTDHSASLEPDGFRRLTRNLKSAKSALAYKNNEIAEIEIVQRDKLKKNVPLLKT
jgi:sialic acid synthase